MKKKYILIGLIAFMLLFALTSNPSKADYISWVKEGAFNEADNVVTKGIIAVLGMPLIEYSTTTKSYLFFSVYRTQFSENEEMISVGMFNNFIPIKSNLNTN